MAPLGDMIPFLYEICWRLVSEVGFLSQLTKAWWVGMDFGLYGNGNLDGVHLCEGFVCFVIFYEKEWA